MRLEAPGDFELWVLLNVKTCVPGFISSFHADPRPLSSHEHSALINTGPADAARQMEWADDALWQIQMKLRHPMKAAEDDGSVLLLRKQAGCHGGEQNWNWAVFSFQVKEEQSGRADKSQQILPQGSPTNSHPSQMKKQLRTELLKLTDNCVYRKIKHFK